MTGHHDTSKTDEDCVGGVDDNTHIPIESVVIGLDLSPTSIEVAKAYLEQDHYIQSTKESTTTTAATTTTKTTKVQLWQGDFFQQQDWAMMYSNPQSSGHSVSSSTLATKTCFDLIFDYTFFCALPPALRPDWGRQIARLLCPQNGRLLTFIYPIVPGAPREEGPPYPVTLDDYRSVLEPNGIVLTTDGAYASDHTVDVRKGKELVAFWQHY